MKRVLLFTFLFLVSGTSFAKGVCDVALGNNAINKSDSNFTSKVTFQKKEDLCNREYESAEEFKNSARNSGFNVGYAGFELGHSGGKSSGSGRLSFKSEEFCQANQLELDSFYTSRIKTSVADIALSAWTDCINVTQKNAFYIEYTESEDANGATGFMHRKIVDGSTKLVITDVKVHPKDADVTCDIGGKTVKRGKADVSLDTARESFTCDKSPDANVKINFGTSIGDTVFVKMRSKQSTEQTKIEELEAQINLLGDKIIALSKGLVNISNSAPIQYEADTWSISNNKDGGGCKNEAVLNGKSANWKKNIKFKKAFASAPKIDYGISFIDTETEGSKRSNGVQIFATNITKDGFTLNAHSWMGCTYRFTANWLAVGQKMPNK